VIPSLETRRLWLRPLSEDDAEQIQQTFPRWEIVRDMAAVVPWPYPPDGALTWIRDVALPEMARGEAWHWTLRLKIEPESVIGAVTCKTGDDNRGFWLGVPWQRRGLMTEAATAATDFWFEVLRFPVLRVAKSARNLPSRRISERQRMRVVATEERQYVSGPALAEVWEITADEWRALRHAR
jgi:[ribosomal protein S5]-alanine N-acetyltransferase